MPEQVCPNCKGKGFTSTDLWDNTSAMSEPCPHCKPKDHVAFWALPDDAQRISWFADKRQKTV